MNIKLKNIAELLARIATMLIASGASTKRVSRNVKRIADVIGYNTEIFYSFAVVILTVEDKKSGETYTITKVVENHGINFDVISRISILSWQAVEENLSCEDINKKLDEIEKIPRYNKYIIYLFVSLAVASLSRIFGGTYIEFCISFFATLLGLIVRSFFQIRKFNHFIFCFFAAFTSVSVVNIFRKFGIDNVDSALASCVLWLIPGVPLINGFLDILTGYTVPGTAKLVNAGVFILMISLGFFLSLILFGYGIYYI